MTRPILRAMVAALFVGAIASTAACGHGKKKQPDKHEHKPGDGHDHGSTGSK